MSACAQLLIKSSDANFRTFLDAPVRACKGLARLTSSFFIIIIINIVKGLSRIFDLSRLSQRRFSNQSKILSARFSGIARHWRIQQENFQNRTPKSAAAPVYVLQIQSC
jgi:hypothetical protein